MVPGVPGYLPLQDREALLWMKSDGNQSPDWWEIEKLKDPYHPPPLTEDGDSNGPMDQQNSVAQPTGDLPQWQENQEYSSSSHNFDSLVRNFKISSNIAIQLTSSKSNRLPPSRQSPPKLQHSLCRYPILNISPTTLPTDLPPLCLHPVDLWILIPKI